MAAHISCTCTPKTTFKNSGNMRVLLRNGNYSHFESPKGALHYSKWSTLVCVGQNGKCPMNYRSKSSKIETIPDLSENDNWQNF